MKWSQYEEFSSFCSSFKTLYIQKEEVICIFRDIIDFLKYYLYKIYSYIFKYYDPGSILRSINTTWRDTINVKVAQYHICKFLGLSTILNLLIYGPFNEKNHIWLQICSSNIRGEQFLTKLVILLSVIVLQLQKN